MLLYSVLILMAILNAASQSVYAITAETNVTDAGQPKGSTYSAERLETFITGENGFLSIVSSIGMVLIAFGTGQMILAFKDDNAESKTKGVMVLLGGFFCVTITVILTNLGISI